MELLNVLWEKIFANVITVKILDSLALAPWDLKITQTLWEKGRGCFERLREDNPGGKAEGMLEPATMERHEAYFPGEPCEGSQPFPASRAVEK